MSVRARLEQEDVDAVAAFVEAAEELCVSALFDEDRNCVSVSYVSHSPSDRLIVEQQLMAENDIRSALIPFRRIFMVKEPSYFDRVRGILHRHMTDAWSQSDLACTSSIYKTTTEGWLGPQPLQSPPSPKDVLDLWMNCKMFHSGRSQRTGRFSRDDFLRFEKQIGPELSEFLFQSAVHSFAICHLNLLPLAKQALANWEKQLGLRPSSPPKPAIRDSCTCVTPSGTVVKRGPGRKETGAQKLERLLSRRSLDNMAGTFHAMRLGWDEIASVCEHKTFVQGVMALGWTVCETDVTSLPDEFPCATRGFSDPASRRKGTISAYGNRRLFVCGDALHLLDKYLQRLRVLLADETV